MLLYTLRLLFICIEKDKNQFPVPYPDYNQINCIYQISYFKKYIGTKKYIIEEKHQKKKLRQYIDLSLAMSNIARQKKRKLTDNYSIRFEI